MTLCWASRWLLALALVHVAFSFVFQPSTVKRCSSKISSKPKDDDDEEARKMALVRSLQSAYYKSESTRPALEKDSGVLRNLPLWRVQWTELPGRSNVLNVHEPIYTNMIETILRGPKPWYVGHLYLPGGSKNLKSSPLKTWEDEIKEKNRDDDRAAVVGTLLRISDYRRLSDGRLVLLVQGLERFVVAKSIQDLPYSVADVQILPDFEKAPELEADARPQRAKAVLDSFQYFDYEYDANFALPLDDNKYLNVMDIWGPALGEVLPFVPYSSTVDPSQLGPIDCPFAEDDDGPQHQLDGPSLESRLLKGRVLQTPLMQPEFAGISLDELERRLWTALDDFCRANSIRLPAEVSCLIPPSFEWSASPIQQLSADYPSSRRQRRLSFAASAFLERTALGTDLRPTWLATPSTKVRLSAVLERFESINDKLLGEFQ